MIGLKQKESVKTVFKNLEIPIFYSLYVLETLKYVKEFLMP